MVKYTQPGGISEGAPSVFYIVTGSPQVAMSVSGQGTRTVLASFPSGYNFTSALVSASDGQLYSGVQQGVSPATVFSVNFTKPGKQVYSPQNFVPTFTQNLATNNLLGIATMLGSSSEYVVTGDLNGNITPIVALPAGDRLDTAIYASDGNYYGVAQTNPAGTGYVFRTTPAGALTTLYTFPVNSFAGYYSVTLLQGSDGNLYGTTPTGGVNGTGSIYKLSVNAKYTTLYSFPSGGNYNPSALLEGSDGNLYGVTLAARVSGQLFRLTKTGQYTLLYTMTAKERRQHLWYCASRRVFSGGYCF